VFEHRAGLITFTTYYFLLPKVNDFRLVLLIFSYFPTYALDGGMPMADEEILTVKEFAERLKLNPETVRRWIKSGRVHGTSLGSDRGGYRIPASEVERILGKAAA